MKRPAMMLLVCVCVCLFVKCMCFSNGSVAFSCGTLTPVHLPFMPATSAPPFTLSTSTAIYRPGDVITVSLEAVASSSAHFQGFLLQARSWGRGHEGGELQWPVGRFINLNNSVFTSLHCGDVQDSTVSQASGAPKKVVQVTWEAPSNSNYGDIFFSATLVQDYTTFWVQMNSSFLRLNTGSTAGVFFSPGVVFLNVVCVCASFSL